MCVGAGQLEAEGVRSNPISASYRLGDLGKVPDLSVSQFPHLYKRQGVTVSAPHGAGRILCVYAHSAQSSAWYATARVFTLISFFKRII